MSIKSQLQSTLDQLDSGLDKEKKSRAALEKQKRKVEGDLKMAQDAVADLERAKREIETVIASKEKNNQMLSAKLDDEQSLVAKAQKNIKELQGRVEATEEELEAERQARAQAERQRSDLSREIDQLGTRLDVAMNLEKDKKLLEAQCKDAGARADEAEVNALKGGRKAMIKMETRIRELES